MTEAEINGKAKEIYKRCFDDEYEYTGVLNALVIAVRETAQDAAKIINKMKCCENCKYSTLDLCEDITCSLGYGDDFEPKCENLKRWELAE